MLVSYFANHKRNFKAIPSFFLTAACLIASLTAAQGYAAPLQAHPSYLKAKPKPVSQALADSSHLIYDMSQSLQEEPAVGYPGLKVVRANDLFRPGTIFFGFGLPNVYMARINSQGQVLKVDAKSLHREPMKVVDTHGKVQSGLFIVPKNLTREEIEEIAALAHKHEDRKDLTCVHTNVSILSEAGFTINGQSIGSYYWPDTLLVDLLQYGLQRHGKIVEFDLVKTSPASLAEILAGIKSAVRQTPWRHITRFLDSKQAKAARHAEAERIKALNDKLFSEQAAGTATQDAEHTYELEISQTSATGSILRRLWGAHMLYKVKIPSGINVDDFLTERLNAFPQANPSLATRLKKNYLFAPSVVSYLHSHMVSRYKPAGWVSADFLNELLPIFDEQVAPNRYNIVVTGDHVVIAKLNVYSALPDWTLTKHVLIANYSKDVRFAGEMWKGADGKIRINANSGTYRPNAEQLAGVVRFANTLFPSLSFEAVADEANPVFTASSPVITGQPAAAAN